jgi:ubiquinol-cytochrome c reductase cytochrome b subunit
MRTALGVAALTFYTILGLAAADDVLAVALGVSLNAILNAYRVLLLVLPPIAAFIAFRLCKELQKRDGPVVDPELVGPDGDEPAGLVGEDDDRVADVDVPVS